MGNDDDQERRGEPSAEKPAARMIDPLRDSLKAIAGAARQNPGTEDGAERTMLFAKREAAAAPASLQHGHGAAETVPARSPASDPAAAAMASRPARAAAGPPPAGKTQLVRGAQRPLRADFHQDPVVGWLVVIGGPGLGAFRPIFEGNNTIGRSASQRIPIDFGDDAISAEEQAFLRYDSSDRQFLLVPNLAKTNVIAVNESKPTAAVRLSAMDVITMGRTQLVFVPFCGDEFDWSELAGLKE